MTKDELINGLYRPRLELFAQASKAIASVAGEIWECGVWRGASALAIRRLVAPTKAMRLFDTFTGIPDKSEWDTHPIGAFKETSEQEVRVLFETEPNVTIHSGCIPQTFVGLDGSTISFAHIDVDQYQATLDCLTYIYPRLSPGGWIVCDDYGCPGCPGAKRAVDEFFADKPEKIVVYPGTTQIYLVKGQINLHQNRRQIRWGWPKGGFGVGDTFLFTSVCRYTDVTYEIPVDSFCGSDLGSILQSVARVEYVHDPITFEESMALYARQYGPVPPLPQVRGLHAARAWLLRFGIDAANALPHAEPPMHEVDWARKWLRRYHNPIVFTPIPGGLKNPSDRLAQTKYVPPEMWDATLTRLSRDHDLLYFTALDNHRPFPHVKTLLGFPVAKIAAIMWLCRKHLGVENGLLHLAIAMGATCRVGMPTVNGRSFYDDCDHYVYAGQMWNTEPCRAFYHLFEDTRDRNNIIFS